MVHYGESGFLAQVRIEEAWVKRLGGSTVVVIRWCSCVYRCFLQCFTYSSSDTSLMLCLMHFQGYYCVKEHAQVHGSDPFLEGLEKC